MLMIDATNMIAKNRQNVNPQVSEYFITKYIDIRKPIMLVSMNPALRCANRIFISSPHYASFLESSIYIVIEKSVP